MRFAIVSLALCAAVNALPVDTSSVTGLAKNVVDTSSVTDAADLNEISARQIDTSSATGLADTDEVDDLVPEAGELGVRHIDTSSVTSLVDTTEVTDLVPETSELGVRSSSYSSLTEDLILEIRHIRFAVVKGIKDEFKDVDPTIGKEVSEVINKLNQFERDLFKDVDLPGDLYNKLTLVTGEIDKVVKSIEKLLINETGVVDPSLGSLVALLVADINSLGGNISKILGL